MGEGNASFANFGKYIYFFPIFLISVSILGAIAVIAAGEIDGPLLYEVNKWYQLDLFESRFAYLFLHLITFFPVFLLSFDKNVHYWKKWKNLLPGLLLVGAFFIVWDIIFTIIGVWGFNEAYLSGFHILHLPIEEWLFFITVPFACVFIYECLNFYVQKDILINIEPYLTIFLTLFCYSISIFYWQSLYTFCTFFLTGSFLLIHYVYFPNKQRSRFYLAYLVILIPFLLINGLLTGGFTEEPIVLYNPKEYLGVRIGSIPIDDAFYGFLLVFANITFFEYYRKKNQINRNLFSQ